MYEEEELYKEMCHRLIRYVHELTNAYIIIDSYQIIGNIPYVYFTTPGIFHYDNNSYTYCAVTYKGVYVYCLGLNCLKNILNTNMSIEEIDLQLTVRGF